jgi:hypothetical protein
LRPWQFWQVKHHVAGRGQEHLPVQALQTGHGQQICAKRPRHGGAHALDEPRRDGPGSLGDHRLERPALARDEGVDELAAQRFGRALQRALAALRSSASSICAR